MDQTTVERAMDQGAFKGAMNGTSDGSVSKRCIRQQSKERWFTQESIDEEVIEGAIDQRAIERAMDLGAVD